MTREGMKKLGQLLANKLNGRDTIFYLPNLEANPYQRLLYSAGPKSFIPAPSLERLEWLAKSGLVSAVHFHWEEWLISSPKVSARIAAEKIINLLMLLKRKEVSIFWTCHNLLPHDHNSENLLKAFERLRQALCSEADLIHVHSQFAAEMLVRTYGVHFDRISVIPHPSYLDYFDAPAPRTELDASRRFLMFGHMKKYKGVSHVADAFRVCQDRDRVASLTFAGSGNPTDFDSLDCGVPIKLRIEEISRADVPTIFSEADFMVLALARSLTSGSALLAMTFGVPVIVPNLPGVVQNLPPELGGLVYDSERKGELERAIGHACRMPVDEYSRLSSRCLDFAREVRPAEASRRLVSVSIERGLLRKVG